mgnify:CR=1 FL=1
MRRADGLAGRSTELGGLAQGVEAGELYFEPGAEHGLDEQAVPSCWCVSYEGKG